MHSPAGYKILALLHSSAKRQHYRALRLSDAQSVVLKVVTDGGTAAAALAALRQECAAVAKIRLI